MLNVQVTFFCQLCHLRKRAAPKIFPKISFKEFAERPWLHLWWSGVLGSMPEERERIKLRPRSQLG